MMIDTNSKVTSLHLKRDAYLYIRQSTLRQVFENQESTKRQYALRNRAIALGWSDDQLQVIDSDLGHSGASSVDREGFQKLVAEVSMGRAGIVIGLEVSRLARNNTDWHRLLEICALSDTLILDEDGFYNPNDFNDRLLLGLKGTMSEAELHFMRARLRGGVLSKAQRGEFRSRLPTGFIYDDQGNVQLHPDKQVRQAIALLFATYRRTGSGSATVKFFREQNFLFPRRVYSKLDKNEHYWKPLTHNLVLWLLHNPRYAGAYFYGRTRYSRCIDGGSSTKKLPRDEWHTLIPDAHDGYITWEEYENNQRQLLASAQAYGLDRRKSPPREGPALLQGIVVCGVCGKRMSVKYRSRGDKTIPLYRCERDAIQYSSQACQSILGDEIDMEVSRLLLETITPLAMEAALAVQQELSARLNETDRLRMQQVERVRHEADLARRRYMLVDPDNRLVADTLEADWNEKLRALRDAKDACEKRRIEDQIQVNEEVCSRVKALTTDFPRLWNDPNTSDRDRKRIVRLLINDVTLVREDNIIVHVRFKGGTTTTLTLHKPKQVQEKYRTLPEVIEQISDLAKQHTDGQIAKILNERGHRSGRGCAFNPNIIKNLRQRYDVKSYYEHLRESGMLNAIEMAARLGTCRETVWAWRSAGLLKAHIANEKNEYLFEPPGINSPVKHSGKKLSKYLQDAEFSSNPIIREQYEV
jgi:DNA invertase Pin-like site-specific DNA recombinase